MPFTIVHYLKTQVVGKGGLYVYNFDQNCSGVGIPVVAGTGSDLKNRIQ